MITPDEITKMAREAGISRSSNPDLWDVWEVSDTELESVARAAYEAGAKAERERIEAERQPPIYSQPLYTSGCPVCGLGANGRVTGYVCNRGDCPTRATCTGAV